MNQECPYEYCYAPESPCNLGELDLSKCPRWKKTLGKPKSEEPVGNLAIEDYRLLPWSGNSLGTTDLEFVAGRSKPKVIGVVGSHKAGKTTLLTGFYLLLSKGHQLRNKRFAGSYTLGGWESLAYPLRWHSGEIPKFPPHTSSNAGRMPGLLHMAFRSQSDVHEDVFFTDAPGEWFARWSIDKEASDAEGARWIDRNADSFMLFADSDALSGEARGEARLQLQTLAQRLSEAAPERPVAVIWSKADFGVPEGIKGMLRKSFQRLFPNHEEFSTSMRSGEGIDESSSEEFVRLMDWILNQRAAAPTTTLSIPASSQEDYLLAFRGKR